jgi:predicted XRE-type DNA-binding protein
MDVIKTLDRLLAISLSKKNPIVIQEQKMETKTRANPDREQLIKDVLMLHSEEKMNQKQIADFLGIAVSKIRTILERHCPFHKKNKLVAPEGQTQTCNCGSRTRKQKPEKPQTMSSTVRGILRSCSDDLIQRAKPKDFLPMVRELGISDSSSLRSCLSIELRKIKAKLSKPTKTKNHKATMDEVQLAKDYVSLVGSLKAAQTALNVYAVLADWDAIDLGE